MKEVEGRYLNCQAACILLWSLAWGYFPFPLALLLPFLPPCYLLLPSLYGEWLWAVFGLIVCFETIETNILLVKLFRVFGNFALVSFIPFPFSFSLTCSLSLTLTIKCCFS